MRRTASGTGAGGGAGAGAGSPDDTMTSTRRSRKKKGAGAPGDALPGLTKPKVKKDRGPGKVSSRSTCSSAATDSFA